MLIYDSLFSKTLVKVPLSMSEFDGKKREHMELIADILYFLKRNAEFRGDDGHSLLALDEAPEDDTPTAVGKLAPLPEHLSSLPLPPPISPESEEFEREFGFENPNFTQPTNNTLRPTNKRAKPTNNGVKSPNLAARRSTIAGPVPMASAHSAPSIMKREKPPLPPTPSPRPKPPPPNPLPPPPRAPQAPQQPVVGTEVTMTAFNLQPTPSAPPQSRAPSPTLRSRPKPPLPAVRLIVIVLLTDLVLL